MKMIYFIKKFWYKSFLVGLQKYKGDTSPKPKPMLFFCFNFHWPRWPRWTGWPGWPSWLLQVSWWLKQPRWVADCHWLFWEARFFLWSSSLDFVFVFRHASVSSTYPVIRLAGWSVRLLDFPALALYCYGHKRPYQGGRDGRTCGLFLAITYRRNI